MAQKQAIPWTRCNLILMERRPGTDQGSSFDIGEAMLVWVLVKAIGYTSHAHLRSKL